MLNLSEVEKFYDSKKKGSCVFVDKYGPCTGEVCGQKTNQDSLFCDDHVQEGVDKEKAISFLRNLTANPVLLDQILMQISYYSLHHTDETKLCEKINCDDCDNDDREFDSRSNITSSLCEIMSMSVQMPSVQMPSVQMPSVQMPSVQMPSVQMPSGPSRHLPSIPSSQIPSIPSSQIPSMPELPTISEHVIFESPKPRIPSIPKVEKRQEIQVTVYGNGLFRDVNTGFILEQRENGIYLIVNETAKCLDRELTSQDFEEARSLGLLV